MTLVTTPLLKRFALLVAVPALLTGACRVNPSFSKLPEAEKQALQPTLVPTAAQPPAAPPPAGPLVADSLRVYKLDAETARKFAAGSSKPYTDVYVYATFCKPCVAELPALLTFFGQRSDVNLLLVTPESWVKLPTIRQFLVAHRVAFPTYVLDLNRYGDEYAVLHRYQQFVAGLYPGHPEVQGLPTHLILNQQGQVVFAGAGAKRVTTATLDSVLRRR